MLDTEEGKTGNKISMHYLGGS